ncbi:hypothetical protein TruAng_002201 [Truncatella angustata]|nr:hypothetical protein TruAng_002201 [Truncatella angustata]
MSSNVASNEPPATRFHLAGHYDASHKPYTMKTPGAMFMEEVNPADFDAGFFGVNHMDASSMDPQQRQLMEVAYECLESAGIPVESLAGARVGCIIGANTVDYYDMTCRDPEDRTESPTMGSNRALLSNRISHFLNMGVPCSSTLVALDMACLYLTTNQCDFVLVGGANMYLSPERNEDMGAMRPTASPTGRCHTFDSKADGYVAAEAINCVLLRRLDDAVIAKDPIRAVIRGTSTNSAGRTPGIAMPSATAQAAAIRAAYHNAGIPEIDYSETGFLECHGTGTLVGDPIEITGAASVFAAGRDQHNLLVIGSVKSNIGHSEGAAGLSGLIKTVLAIENGIIPGTATFLEPNPRIDFEASKVRASRTAVRWPSNSKKRASINSFGFGGANAHAIVESPQYLLPGRLTTYKSSYKNGDRMWDDFFEFEEPGASPTPGVLTHTKPQIVVLSANDEESLKASIEALVSHLLYPSVSIQLNDLAYTLSERRSQLYYRAYSIQHVSSKLSTTVSQETFTVCKRSTSKPTLIGFVFTGQGAQWPQMGKDLLESFPIAMKMVQELDIAIQTMEQPPPWSLVEELIVPRSAAAFREPEFSQPLVTALQLAYLAVLSQWGIKAKAAVGHSSGEIVAAYYCGYITASEAIKIAYLRGQAVKNVPPQAPLGMLAVGAGADDVMTYLQDYGYLVQIACFNSPRSVTLSGTVEALEQVKMRLETSSVFARMLLVNAAYHSTHMLDVGVKYRELLENATQKPGSAARPHTDQAIMYSSVTGERMNEPADVTYWHQNMVSPVRFQQATSAMLSSQVDGEDAINFLLEIGPSNALSGPISQIYDQLSSKLVVLPVYSSVAKRGQQSLQSLFDTAGQLFGAGYAVSFSDVNEYNQAQTEEPSIIVDLPNYAWNHSKKYWHESLASKDWRYRPFIRHDLLGTKILGTSWNSPIFRNRLRLKDNPWLRDHKLGEQVVFPGAAYVAMALEAMYQHSYMVTWTSGANVPKRFQYHLKDIKFARALVLDDLDDYSMISLSLSAVPGSIGSWHAFQVSSLRAQVDLKSEDVWRTHATGLIRIETGFINSVAAPESIAPLKHSIPAKLWYKSMRDSGFNFGPSFQKHLAMEYTAGHKTGRSTVDLSPPLSIFRQSEYLLHPACIDGCFQTVTSSIWQGDRSAVNAALVPFQIDSLTIPHRSVVEKPKVGISNAISQYGGTGRRDIMKHYTSSCQVYHPGTGTLILDMKGLRYTELDSTKESTLGHTYAQLTWDVDIDMLSQTTFENVVEQVANANNGEESPNTLAAAQKIMSLAAHKNPNLNVLEINLNPTDISSLWLRHHDHCRMTFSQYRFLSDNAHCVVAAREAHANLITPKVDFVMLDLTKPFTEFVNKFDFVIIKTTPGRVSQELGLVLVNVQAWLSDNGGQAFIVSMTGNIGSLTADIIGASFSKLLFSDALVLAYQQKAIKAMKSHEPREVHVVKFDSEINTTNAENVIREALSCDLIANTNPFALPVESKILVLDEINGEVLSKMTKRQWNILHQLISLSCSILWVTTGAQGLSVTQPSKALINGLFRVIRNEEPLLNLINLDIEHASTVDPATISSIVTCLELLQKDRPKSRFESEFSCRQGLIYISRVVPDLALNLARDEEFLGRAPEIMDLHDSPFMIHLRAERIGNIDSLQYSAVAPERPVLRENEVEIQVFASGVNFKEVAVTIGIIPENEFLLGGEGAGIVTRIAADVTKFVPGQRVAFFEKGSFANRVITKTEAVIGIEDPMSYEEAATIPCVFMTSYYSLIHLANVRKGNTVLIHSAAGGVGISAIQLCQHLGATVYATVGTPEKREFLRERFSIPDDRIFSSRTPAFGAQILEYTSGKGVDVILNSLTGNLLDESWRIVADGGIMVEIGKRDILDRKSLSMEPFNRNASFRALDLSHKEISDDMIASLLEDVFKLMAVGSLKPISPIQVFPFSDIPSAFRLMRSGKHIVRPMARSGEGKSSQKTIEDITALGCEVQLFKGDVSNEDAVRHILASTKVPVGGIVQGAMLLRDRTFASMTVEEYHDAITCKLQGTWNLHNVSLDLGLSLDFFTLLSSISGLYGSKGQANYAAANAFLDAFALYRSETLGQPTTSVDLGVIEDVGYMAEHKELQSRYDPKVWYPINERLLKKVFGFSILQQDKLQVPNPSSAAHMITGFQIPQVESSFLSSDARFSPLFSGASSDSNTAAKNEGSKRSIQAILVMAKSNAERRAILDATVNILNKYLVKSLRLAQDLNTTRPLSTYGIDSLAAVEFRNFVKSEFGVELTTLEVVNASSLTALCEKLVERILVGQNNTSEHS